MTAGTDLRDAARALLKRPAFTAIAVSTLAVGIAATTAMFAVVYHLFMAPLPFPDADRLAYVTRTSDAHTIDPAVVQMEAWARNANTLEWVEPYESREFTVRLVDEAAEIVPGGTITPTLAGRLDITPVIGRGFSAEDAMPAAAPVVVLAEPFWRARFAGRRDVLGTTVRIDGVERTVIGVMPARFAAHQEKDRTAQLWLPFMTEPDDPMPMSAVLVKLAAGVTHEQASRQLDQIASAIPLPIPIPGEWRTVVTASGNLADNTRRAVLILFAAVGLVLLISCANVSGLLLARGADRRQELAVRAALGASAARITRLLLSESALLALAAAAVGIVLSTWIVELIRVFRPADLRVLDAMSISPPVALFAVLVATVAALLAGVTPALQARRVDLIATMRGGATEHSGGLRLRRALLTGEIALCMVLVLGAVLLIRTVTDLQRTDLGYNTAGVMSVEFRLPARSYGDTTARRAFAELLIDRTRSLPGVAAATIASGSPANSTVQFGSVMVEGSDVAATPPGPVPMTLADEQYPAALGIPLRAGRYPTANDPAHNAVVVNESFARRHGTPEDMIGRRLRLDQRWLTIVGVAGDVTAGGPLRAPAPLKLYTPFNYSLPSITLIVRTEPGLRPLSVLPALRSTVQHIDPELPVRNATTLEQQLSGTIARERFVTILLTAFSLIATILAVTGVYGLVSYVIARRTREIGIRMALGASRPTVHRMLFAEGAKLALAGVLAGSVLAMWSASLLQSLLHGAPARDPAALVVTALAVGGATCLAIWLPARRATRIDPLTAVRDA